MTPSERRLKWLLRWIGTVSALAIVPVFMPRNWMALCHQALGLGPFPDGPIIEYLARSLSMFYAMWGGVLWLLSRDVRANGGAITLLAVGTMLGGGVLLSIDGRSHLPLWWIAMEGPFVIVMGAVILILRLKARAEARATKERKPT